MKISKSAKIALDVDGVLCNFVYGVLKRAEEMGLQDHFPKTEEEVDTWNISPKFSDVMRTCWDNPTFWLNLPPLRDSNLPFTPYCYLTSRFINSSVTEEWLTTHNFPKAKVISVSNPVAKVEVMEMENIDVLIDDLYTTIQLVNSAGKVGILYRAPYQVSIKECDVLPTITTLEEICII